MSTTAAPLPTCSYCGAFPHDHLGQCPAIKAIEYFPDGSVKRIEKHEPESKSLFERTFGPSKL